MKTGQASIAWNAAQELEHVGLDDALALVLLVVDDPRARRRALAGPAVPGGVLGDAAPRRSSSPSALSGLPDRSAAIALSGACTELRLERAGAATRAAYVHVDRAATER